MQGLLPIRERNVQQVLNKLEEDSSTGPDLLSTKNRKHCASTLKKPVARIARQILRSGEWPKTWVVHWVHPLHKRKSKSLSVHYRGIHLTAQVSKVIECVLGK